MKRNKDFDRDVREKLENLAPGFHADSWDKLQDRLDAEEVQGDWDAQFSQRLRQIERPYNRASWQALAERLDLEEKRMNQLYSAKAKELLFMALLLFSITQFFTFSPDPAAYQAQQNTPDPSIDQPGFAPISAVHAAASNHAAVANTPASRQGGGFKNSLIPPFTTTNLPGSKLPTSFTSFDLAVGQMPLFPLEIPAPMPLKSFAAPVAESLEESLPTPHVLAPEASLIAATKTPKLLSERELSLGKGLSQQTSPRKRFVRIGMMGASDYNRIITPPVRVNTDIVSLDRYALGYSGGITVGFESGRWEVETGFIYTAKRYYPLQVLYVEGSLADGIFGGGIRQTEFDIMQVPLNFRYNFLSRDRWRIYGLIGASLHVVAQANYYIADLNDYESSTFRPQPSDGGRDGQERPEVFQNQILSQGWLDGGNLLDNSYLGLNIGAGVERYMSPRWSLFAQPTYYHSLIYPNKGLGPVNDRIHTMSLFMGVKVRL